MTISKINLVVKLVKITLNVTSRNVKEETRNGREFEWEIRKEKQIRKYQGSQVRKSEWMKWLSVEICQTNSEGSGGITRNSVSLQVRKFVMQK